MQSFVSSVREKEKKRVNRKGSDVSRKMFWITTAACFLIDQASKLAVLRIVGENSTRKFFSYFSLTCIKNKGICFGMFNSGSTAKYIIVLSIIVAAAIAVYVQKETLSRPLLLTLGLIQGGIVGNLADRVRFGAVVDFIDFRIWPVFNFADTFIVSGVILTILIGFQGKKCVLYS